MAEHHTLRLVTLWVLREGGEMGESFRPVGGKLLSGRVTLAAYHSAR